MGSTSHGALSATPIASRADHPGGYFEKRFPWWSVRHFVRTQSWSGWSWL